LRETLTRLQTPSDAGAVSAAQLAAAEASEAQPATKAIVSAQVSETSSAGDNAVPTAQAAPSTESQKKKDDPPRKPSRGKIGGLLVERGHVQASDITRALEEQEQGDRRRLGEILVALGLAKHEDVLAAQQTLDAKSRDTAPETIRVGEDPARQADDAGRGTGAGAQPTRSTHKHDGRCRTAGGLRMARNVSEAAHGSGEITSNIAGVADAAESTPRGAGDTQKAAQQLVETSAELRRLVEQFKIDASEGNRAAAPMKARSKKAAAGA
jgi:methyl-accepting chemotaxis protein